MVKKFNSRFSAMLIIFFFTDRVQKSTSQAVEHPEKRQRKALRAPLSNSEIIKRALGLNSRLRPTENRSKEKSHSMRAVENQVHYEREEASSKEVKFSKSSSGLERSKLSSRLAKAEDRVDDVTKRTENIIEGLGSLFPNAF